MINHSELASIVLPGKAIAYRDITSPQEAKSEQLGDGTRVSTDEEGSIIFAHYANGSKVKRHSNYVLVRSTNGTYWLGDAQGRWFPMD